MFTPDGDTVFLSEQKDEDLLESGEKNGIATAASKVDATGQFRPVPQGGGLYTTQLMDQGKPALTMGAAAAGVQPTQAVPFKRAPQAQNHLQYAAPTKKKPSRSDRKMSEQQKVERR